MFNEQIFSNHVLRELIFKNLTVEDLNNCARVSKVWNQNSRDYMRKKNLPCFIVINRSCTLEDLESLIDLISNGNHAFNGIHWITSRDSELLSRCYGVTSKELATFSVRDFNLLRPYQSRIDNLKKYFDKILAFVPLRHLSIVEIPEFYFTNIVEPMKMFPWGNIQTLKTNIYSVDFHLILDELASSGFKFTNLKSITMNPEPRVFRKLPEFTQLLAFLQSARVLEEYNSEIACFDLNDFIIAGKVRLVKQLWISPDTSVVDLKTIIASAEGLCIESLNLKFLEFPNNQELIARIPVILEILARQSSSLREILINQDCMDAIIAAEIQPMPNIRQIKVVLVNSSVNYIAKILMTFPHAGVLNEKEADT